MPDPEEDENDASWSTVLQRCWILFVLSLVAFEQGWLWNMYGPIAPSIQKIYGWSDGTIATLANWGPFSYTMAVVPTAYLLDTKGMRVPVALAAGLVAAGAAVKCITVEKGESVLVLAHIGAFLNGLAGPVAMAAGPICSNTWFPVKQRTVATAIVATMNVLGVAGSFTVGPAFVPKGGKPEDLMRYELWSMGVAMVTLVFVLAHFPSRPLHSPSVSATTERHGFVEGLKALKSNRQFWLLSAGYGVVTGFYGGWGPILSLIMQRIHQDEATAGWIGFWTTLVACVGGLVVSFVADRIKAKKPLLLCSLGVALVTFTLLSLLCQRTEWLNHFGLGMLYTLCILGGLFINCTIPLFYEAGAEAAFPVAEGSACAALTLINNFACLVFLLPAPLGLPVDNWANWALVGACIFCLASVLAWQEKHTRLALDDEHWKTEQGTEKLLP